MTRKPVEFEYADNPVCFKQLYEELGSAKLGEMLGYTPNSLSQMYRGVRKTRQFIEFACEQYINNQLKKDREDHIFFFIAKKDSSDFQALKTVADAVGIPIQNI